nr:MAG TPA: hypothetical protein [Caudoviricetes sp.]
MMDYKHYIILLFLNHRNYVFLQICFILQTRMLICLAVIMVSIIMYLMILILKE